MLRIRIVLATLLVTTGSRRVQPTGRSAARATGATAPTIAGCPVFPADNAWNTNIAGRPVNANSANYLASINASGTTLHADFGGDGEYGIPYLVVARDRAVRTIHYTAYGDESDPGPFPIPPTAPVEGGADPTGDRHVLVVQRDTCHLYELGRAFWRGDHWDATVGVNWDLRSNALRPRGWTSADAAGLPILPGLVRYDEVASGAIDHALRFTVQRRQHGYILPATHYASSNTDPEPAADGAAPPAEGELRPLAVHRPGARHPRSAEEVRDDRRRQRLDWFITGAADPRWNDDDLNQLKTVPGSAFEAVDTGPVHYVALGSMGL